MTTTQKHKAFVAEPMGQKPVTELPGVGPVLGQRLAQNGFGQASGVLGQYLVLNQDEGRFCDWMRHTCGANTKQQGDCYRSLREWSYGNL